MYYIVTIHAITNIFTTECSFISMRYTYLVRHIRLKLINMKEVTISTCLFTEQLEVEEIFSFYSTIDMEKNFLLSVYRTVEMDKKISYLKAIITTLKLFTLWPKWAAAHRKKIQKL